MSDHTFKAAVIGVGRANNSGQKGGGHQIGYTHAAMFKNSPRCTLIAGVDINRENLEAFCARFAVPHGFNTVADLLGAVRPDIVSIATYVGLHRQFIEVCAEGGVKAIICEKPFVASPADLEAVRSVVARTGVKLVVAHIRRYAPGFEQIKRLLETGAMGQPLHFFAGIEGWDLSEWGSHWLDMFRFFLDDQPLRWVMGQARVRSAHGYGHAMEDHAVACWEFENGCKALLDGGRGFVGQASMTITGTAGMIRCFGDAERLEVFDAAGRREELYPADWNRFWDAMLDELIAWIEGGPVPRVGLPRVDGSAELNLAAYLSAVAGDRIDLPLDEFGLDEWPLEVLARRATRSEERL